ncbi:hypothetical protein VIGAN_07240300 [Vigna angularis var. angularis]|uniref:Uncharacterized protein n=1 Tax=Vigna angularis var. angularis TaxID=157739 RepID=A0A0S3SKY3_PHAAN|nr:hypothetical protein VIGAN_06160300 [Vigna angularis var. angularis]BAT93441.1 hypothetical protein VIGAN_07240300 [Vigna angularis var. angularis]
MACTLTPQENNKHIQHGPEEENRKERGCTHSRSGTDNCHLQKCRKNSCTLAATLVQEFSEKRSGEIIFVREVENKRRWTARSREILQQQL